MLHCMYFTVYFTRYIQALFYIHCNEIFFTYTVNTVKNHTVYIQGFTYTVTSTVALCCFSQGFHNNVYKPCNTVSVNHVFSYACLYTRIHCMWTRRFFNVVFTRYIQAYLYIQCEQWRKSHSLTYIEPTKGLNMESTRKFNIEPTWNPQCWQPRWTRRESLYKNLFILPNIAKVKIICLLVQMGKNNEIQKYRSSKRKKHSHNFSK